MNPDSKSGFARSDDPDCSNRVPCAAVSSFQTRLRSAASAYKGQQAEDGGWREERYAEAPTSIVNTVEVLAVLRAAGTPYESDDSDTIFKALRYLSNAVKTHPQPRPDEARSEETDTSNGAEEEGRGEHTRYCAWGLCGLTLFKESRHDRRLREAQGDCVAWLAAHELEGGGAWSEGPEDEHPSLLSTSAAITGLARVCAYHPAGEQADGLVKRARAVVRSLAHRSAAGRSQRTAWWPLDPSEPRPKRSASATAMAVIALSRGGPEDQLLAAEGARWLLKNRKSWTGRVVTDGLARGANWHHMTFSLALRAILRATRRPSDDHALRPVVEHLDELWIEEERAWAHGQRGARASPSGSYAVVTAYEAMARAWPFDAQREILRDNAKASEGDAEAPDLRLRVTKRGMTLHNAVDGVKLNVTLEPVHRRMIRLIAERHSWGAALHARSWGIQELAQELGDLEPDTVRRYAWTINNVIKEEATRKRTTQGDIVQISKKRVHLAVDQVTIDN
jgi:hypothetical protein